MDPVMTPGRTVTLWQLLGPAASVVAVVGVVLVLGLFVAALVCRLRHRGYGCLGWWLRGVSVWMVIFGIVAYSTHMGSFHCKVGMVGVNYGELLNAVSAEAYARLAVSAMAGLLGWTCSMIVGQERKD